MAVCEGVAVAVRVALGVCEGEAVAVNVLVGVKEGVGLGVKFGSRQIGVESERLRGSRVWPCSS